MHTSFSADSRSVPPLNLEGIKKGRVQELQKQFEEFPTEAAVSRRGSVSSARGRTVQFMSPRPLEKPDSHELSALEETASCAHSSVSLPAFREKFDASEATPGRGFTAQPRPSSRP